MNSAPTNRQTMQAEDLTFDQLLSRGREQEKTLLKKEQKQLEESFDDAKLALIDEMNRRGITKNPALLYGTLKNALFSTMAPALPIITLIAFLFAGSSRIMARYETLGTPIPETAVFTTRNWKLMVDRLRDDNRATGRPHEIILGFSAVNNSPVIIPRTVLREHAHFLGDTGSGKTSLGLSPLLAQLLSAGDCSVIVLDLKGDDRSLFELVRMGAMEHQPPGQEHLDSALWNYPFRYFSSALNQSSHVFNPWMQKSLYSLNSTQRADLVSTALGLQYGTDYGRKFYGDANFNLLQAVLEQNPKAQSFAELLPHIQQPKVVPIDRMTKQAASNLGTSVQRLASVPPLNFVPGASTVSLPPESMIELADLFETPQALYFNLPGATGSVVNAELARLVLFSLINAAQVASKPRKQVYVLIDEFQRIVSNNIEVLMQMARSHDVGIILANQSLGDLKQRDADILNTVTSNTRLRQIFGVNEPSEIRQIIEASGESILLAKTFSEVLSGLAALPTALFRETPTPRLRVNDLIETSDHPLRSVFQLRRGAGMAQYGGYPFVIESVFHITEAEYERRRNASWPLPTDSAKILPQTPTIQKRPLRTRAKLKSMLTPFPTDTVDNPFPDQASPDQASAEQLSLFPPMEADPSTPESDSPVEVAELDHPTTPPPDPDELKRLLDDLDKF